MAGTISPRIGLLFFGPSESATYSTPLRIEKGPPPSRLTLELAIEPSYVAGRRGRGAIVSMSSREHVAMTELCRKDTFDLDKLLHPANAYGHPREVLADQDLTLNEKRAILASWASDACAIEAAPTYGSGKAARRSLSMTSWKR